MSEPKYIGEILKQTYPEKLRDVRWQKRRLEIMNRDQWKCQYCKKSAFLNVHHLFYLPGIEPWEYDDKSLITLCEKCHQSEQRRQKHEAYLLEALRMNGFMADELLKLSVIIHNDPNFCQELHLKIKELA
jgi:hypothetical protein